MKKTVSLPRTQGFALVVTLIMVVLAAIMVIALLTNTTLERTTATSYANRFNAELAVQNGLEAAKKALSGSPAAPTAVTADDTFLVARVAGPAMNIVPNPAPNATPAYYYLAKPQAGNANKIDYYPLFAGADAITNQPIAPGSRALTTPTPPPNPLPSDSNAAIQTDRGATKITKAYPEVPSWLAPASTKWIEVVDPADAGGAGSHTLPYQRYTFWIEDLAGYIDPSVAGNKSGVGGAQKRGAGTVPDELALFTVLEPALPADTGNTAAKTFIDNRGLLLTVPTLKQLAPTLPADLVESHLAVRLLRDSEQALVPRGFGYGNEGTPKKNLNERLDKLSTGGVTAGSLVSELGNWIDTSLPRFKTRGGGMVPQDYLDNTAANIIDYADADDRPTSGNSNKFRGIDSYPLLVSLYDLCEWNQTSAAPPYTITIKKTTYVQVWNMTDKTLTGTLRLAYNNTDTIRVNNSTVAFHNPNYADVTAVSLAPNEFKAVKMLVTDGTDSKAYTWGSTPPASNAYVPFTPQNDTNTATLLWNGAEVDRTLGGLRHPVTTSTGNSSIRFQQRCWHGNTAAPIFQAVGSFGDPRATWFLNNVWKSAGYDSTSYWGGRVTGSGYVLQPSAWPDSGHDFPVGKNPNGDAEDPPAVVARATQDRKMFPAKISNSGSYVSMAELGNLFDPAKWTINGNNFSAQIDGGDIPVSAAAAPGTSVAPSADADGGGGYTLRIGRPEFAKFDQDLMRAWQLLDIFAAGSGPDVIARKSTIGLVNVNTASRESLRALGTAIVNGDTALPTPLSPPFNSLQADRFADAVLAGRPFLSTAQLSTIRLDPAYVADPAGNPPGPNPTPFFGNSKQWATGVRPSQLSDTGFEDLFSRTYGLATVRSRNFRIFVTGQSLDRTGTVLSTVSRVFQVAIKPDRAADGAIQSSKVEVMYEAQL
ncbi:MAG: pilus assembly PilX family protein [Chthoniobacterales bacterium]